jgi:hypothetical protein
MLIALVLRTAVQGLEKLGAGPWLSVVVMLVGRSGPSGRSSGSW